MGFHFQGMNGRSYCIVRFANVGVYIMVIVCLQLGGGKKGIGIIHGYDNTSPLLLSRDCTLRSKIVL